MSPPHHRGQVGSTLALLAVLIGGASGARAQVVSLEAVADSFLKKGSANQNQGGESLLRVQASGQNRVLVRFDQGEIAAAVGAGSLVAARLELFVESAGSWGSTGRPVDAHRLIASWSELGATWNCPDDATPGNSSADCGTLWAGGSFASPPAHSVTFTNGLIGWVAFDVAADVAGFLAGTENHGWLLKLADEGQSGNADSTSREGAAGQRPRLVLEVEGAEVDPSPPSLAITAPSRGTLVNEAAPEIVVEYTDAGSGVDLGSLSVAVDGVELTGCSAGASQASCTPPALAAGEHTVSAEIRDLAGNLATASFVFELLLGDGPHTVSFPAAADGYLRSGSPNQNQGAETFLRVRSSGQNRALVRFDAAEVAAVVGAATLISAELEVYAEANGGNWGPDGRTVDAHRLTADWSETAATWNCAADADPGDSQAGCDPRWDGGAFEPDPTGSALHTNDLEAPVRFEVTADVASTLGGAADYGWLLKLSDEGDSGHVEYSSREGAAGQAPRLEVVFAFGDAADVEPPELRLVSPGQSVVVNDPTPLVTLDYADAGVGVDLATLEVRLDGADLAASCSVGSASASCEPPALAAGRHTIEARLADANGNESTLAFSFDLLLGDGALAASFPALADTYLKAGMPNRNQGAETVLRVRQSGKNRALVRFDPAAISAAVDGGTLISAKLELYVEGNGENWGPDGRPVGVHRLSTAWSELGATWNCPDDADPGDQSPDCDVEWAGGDFEPAATDTVVHTRGLTGWVQFDVTADVAAMLAGAPAEGWLVKKDPEGQPGLVEYTSREGTAGQRPRLMVVFEPSFQTDPEPPTVTISAPGSVVTDDRTPEIVVEYADALSGVDTSTLTVLLDGAVILDSCAVGPALARCEPPPLDQGAHLVFAGVDDGAGNSGRAQSVFTVDVDENPPVVDVLSPADSEIVEGSLPGILAAFVDLESGIDFASVRVRIDGSDLTSTCTVEASTVSCPPPSPEPAVGAHVVTVEAADARGNLATAGTSFEVLPDTRPPVVEVLSPADATVFGDAAPPIRVRYRDFDTGVSPASFSLTVDGLDLTASCDVGPLEAACQPAAVGAGVHVLTAAVADLRGNVGSVVRTFEIDLGLAVTLTSPEPGRLTRETAVDVSGLVSPRPDSVVVRGVEAVIEDDGTFFAEAVPLVEGNNTLTAVARTASGGIGTATVQVVRDTQAPQVSILSPPDGHVTTSPQVLVTGEINDPASANVETVAVAVQVNGLPAEVAGQTFMVPELLLQPGENRIVVEATDGAGNTRTAEVEVTQFVGLATLTLEELRGNRQRGRAGAALAEPLTVQVRDYRGNPLAGRAVRFEVTRGTGTVTFGGESTRAATVQADAQGLAEVLFTLGGQAGAGVHEVTVTTPGFPGALIFCASADHGPPHAIVRTAGSDASGAMTAVAGERYPKPFLAQVFDASGNPVPGVDVTWSVVTGDGSFAGEPELTTATDAQGIASAFLTLGPFAGVNNNVATARFEGLEGLPAVFTVSGVEPGSEEDTAIVGIVLDNQDEPMPDVAIGVAGTTLATTTDAEGRFRIDGAPVGAHHLVAAGNTTSRPGTWPVLNFEIVTIAGHENDLGMPIRMVPIDLAGGRVVGGDEDVVIPLAGVAGASLTVFANSATFPDGSRTGVVSFSQVHNDKVPMEPPMGSVFDVAVTIQPPGVHFDPPARLTLPNLGHPPGAVLAISSFDHDIGEFVSAGCATVTADGRFLVSNPGFGVIKAGWHGGTFPAPTTNACGPGRCTRCTPQGPEPICTECEVCSGEGCKKRELEEVTATARGVESDPKGAAAVEGRPSVKAADDEDELVVGAKQEVQFEATKVLGNCPAEKLKYTWNFGDGTDTEEGKVVTHEFENARVEPYMVRVDVECEGCPEAGTANDTIDVRVIRLDLRIQNLPEEDEPEPNEEEPGGFIPLNNDDDNDNKVLDFRDAPVPGDDELVTLRLDVDNNLEEGEVELDATEGEDKVKVWADRAKAMEIELPKTWDLEEERVPGVVFVEGVEKSASKGDVTLKLTYENDRCGKVEDEVKATVVEVDLDVDSDNNDGFMPPARTEMEDAEEDYENDPIRPGKYVLVNDNDDDMDTITDFADGFNRDAALAADDVNAQEMFVPIVLSLPQEIDIAMAKVRITYDASDPATVTAVDVPQDPATITVPDYQKGGGHLRLWTEPGNAARNPSPVASGGHFIPDGTYDTADLGFSAGVPEKTFYVEAIARSVRLGDQRILVEVDPDGDSGPANFDLKDAVRLSVARLVVRDAGDGNREIEGGDMAFIDGGPRMPQLSATVLPDLMNDTVISCRMEFEFDRTPGTNRDGMPDRVVLPVGELGDFIFFAGQVWDIAAEYPTLPEDRRFFGGDGFIECNGGAFMVKYEFRIRGRNPDDGAARDYIDDRFMPGFDHLAYAIAKHESRIPNNLRFAAERYHQFDLRGQSNVRVSRLYAPLLGDPDGWGIVQVDLTRARDTDPNAFLTISELWNWQALVRRAIPIINEKRDIGDDWLNDDTRVRFAGGACVTDALGNALPHGQRAQSGIAVHGGVWRANVAATGGRCEETTPGAWVGAVPMFVPIPNRMTGNCTFTDGGAFSFEDAAGLKCFNGCDPHYVSWVVGAWAFNDAPNNYVEEVCDEVEP